MRSAAVRWGISSEATGNRKTIPICLEEVRQLPDSEKAYDRQTAMGTIKRILRRGYRAIPGGES